VAARSRRFVPVAALRIRHHPDLVEIAASRCPPGVPANRRHPPPQARPGFEAGAPAAADGERKTVTALFADIKGSMELMAGLDPEEARAIVDPALKLMMDAVYRYDGYFVQSTRDSIFALFGAPVAHENHPQRPTFQPHGNWP
jgi:class 3 adenylate cyclase